MAGQSSKLLKLLPFIIVAIIVAVIAMMFASKPKAGKRPSFDKPIIVEVKTVEAQPFQVYIESYGNIEAKTAGDLVAQVSGIITSVSNDFESGRSFKRGDLLATIDDKDYRIEVTIAQAELANALLTLEQEEALAEQAKRDWEKINPNKKASSLVLRMPQVASAKAKLDAAKARLAKAKLALDRTKVLAPYDGMIVEKQADLGQLVNQNTPIARIFASSSLEVRLPVPASKVQFLPNFDVSTSANESWSSEVELKADFGGFAKSWTASLDRSDSTIDQSSRQWFVTAKLDGELLKSDPLLKIGQFVNARINGKAIADVIVIPSKYIYDNNQVYLYQDGKLNRRRVEISWQGDQQSLIQSGLASGDKIITTPLNFVADGVKVQLQGEAPQDKKAQNRAKQKVKGDKKVSKQGEQP
ncbi:efflux RND transporter periplasmic adaptor subunit [Kangiella sp. TOML190]|uniref:efflux RND transporter periplasmic adaptor subunit n=1 Tax=Kangiella sp. TOML190 TaxID=2931351 RepID=UPI00203BD787|nr:efflux RND transporter periplasmic adaptor subunit [Kangiella sp. TOML190]